MPEGTGVQCKEIEGVGTWKGNQLNDIEEK